VDRESSHAARPVRADGTRRATGGFSQVLDVQLQLAVMC